MAKPCEKEKIKTGQLLCDYLSLCKVWFEDQTVKKPKASSQASPLPSPKVDRKLKVRYMKLYRCFFYFLLLLLLFIYIEDNIDVQRNNISPSNIKYSFKITKSLTGDRI